MKICLASTHHNANVGIVTWLSLEAAGHTVFGGLAGQDTPGDVLQYMSRMPQNTLVNIVNRIKEVRPDVLHLYCHDLGTGNKQFVNAAREVGALVVCQTGTRRYRKTRHHYEPGIMLVETEDLICVEPRNILYWPPPDWDYLPTTKELNLVPHVAHLPRGTQKGTPHITAVMENLKGDGYEFTWDTRAATKYEPWEKHIARVAQADIYIGAMQPIVQGCEAPGSSVSVREACALGCIVVTMGDPNIYPKFYEVPRPVVSCGPAELYDTLASLLTMPQKKRFQLAHRLHTQFVQTHHYKPSGDYLTRIYEQALAR